MSKSSNQKLKIKLSDKNHACQNKSSKILIWQPMRKQRLACIRENKEKVHIQFPNSMCGVFIDRFGKDITFRPVQESTANVRWMSISVRSSSG